MRQQETHFTQFWRAVDARLADECERPATALEIHHHSPMFRAFLTDEQCAASIIRQRIEAARASVKAA